MSQNCFESGIELEFVRTQAGFEIERAFETLIPEASILPLPPFEELGNRYTAKASTNIVIPSGRDFEGDIHVVLFQPGDGTGDRKSYELSNIPLERTPRAKTDHAELFIPLGTGIGLTERWVSRLNSLELLGLEVDTHRVKLIKHLGLKPMPADYILNKGVLPNVSMPRPEFTLDRDARPPYGDPHAVAFNSSYSLASNQGVYQVAAFLAFPEPCETLDRIRDVIAS